MNLSKVYKKSLTKKWLVRLKTKHCDGQCRDGVVLKETKTFVVLAEEDGFEFDGISILAKEYIKGFRDGKYESCCNKIIRFNGQLKKVKLPVWLNSCEDFEDILRTCKERDIWASVEVLFKKRTKSAFYIGPIIGGNSGSCLLRCYDADGKWEKKYTIFFNEIFRVTINDRYGKQFNNFMRSLPSAWCKK